MSHIPLEKLEAMFHGMKTQAGWDVEKDLLWGYFFTDQRKERLPRVAERLQALGYCFVEIYPAEDQSVMWLHVEKIETHSPRSLFQRNSELERLAAEFSVEYDGMDVGPVLSAPEA